jgi:hypothetical protein
MMEGLPVDPTRMRVVVALLAGVVLVYLTVERAAGEDDDPTLRASSTSETGSMSVLVSGTKAVLVLAGVVAMALVGPGMGVEPVVRRPAVVLAALGLVVVAHWIYEKEERET